MKGRGLRWMVPVLLLVVGAGCGQRDGEEVRIEGVPLIEGKDLSEVVEVPVARPAQVPETALTWPERRQTGEPAFAPGKKLFRKPVFEPVDLEALVIYAEGDLLPEEWLQKWARKEGLIAVQRALPEDGQPPRDADVLLAGPTRIARWAAAGLLEPLTAGENLVGVAPQFLGHAFDPANRWSRPVRWTPFLLVARSEKAATYRGMSLEQLLKDPGGVWPDDGVLLAALRLKDQGASANTRRASRQRHALQEALAWTEGRRIRPGDGWRKVGGGEVDLTLVRASGRVSAPGTDKVAWWFPEGGTLVALQLVAIPGFSDRLEAAKRFVEFVLAAEQQQRLVEATGYFSVRLREVDNLTVGGERLPVSKGWLDKAEFLWREAEP